MSTSTSVNASIVRTLFDLFSFQLKNQIFQKFNLCVTDGPRDGPTDGQTDGRKDEPS